LYLIEYCIKKLPKVEINIIQIKNRLNDENIEQKLNECSVCKIFNYLVT